VQIADEDKDTSLPDKLREELPGILAWAVRGALDWQKSGLREPEAVKEATAEYKEESDVLADFLTDCCVLLPKLEVTAAAIFAEYTEWCEKNNDRPLGKKTFGTRLREQKGIQPGTSIGPAKARGWLGIGLKSEKTDVSDKSNPVSPMNKPVVKPHGDIGDFMSQMSETSEEESTDPFADEEDI
jgi:putative DNA primase/helicase